MLTEEALGFFARLMRCVTHHGDSPVRVLVIADEWFPSRGGLSAFNRNLCRALARSGAIVFCLLPRSSRAEKDDAMATGVHLLDALLVPGGLEREALMRKPILPEGIIPDVILGHGRVTGPAAKVQVEDHFPNAKRIHIVHMEPDQIEWYKLDLHDDAGVRAEERTTIELELGRNATRVVAVGPKLHRWMLRDLSVFDGIPAPLRIDPGFDSCSQDIRTPPPGDPQILVLGRMADAAIKGLDIAAMAMRNALDLCLDQETVELLIRGVPVGQAAELRESVREWMACTSVRVTVRTYTTEFERIHQDLRRASLVLMPSRVEGFGLAGLEAILAGAPVLVSDRSGLGVLLREILPRDDAARVVVPVRDDPSQDVPMWGHAIAAVLRDRSAAFNNAATVRRLMAEQRTWAMAARQLLDSVNEADPRC